MVVAVDPAGVRVPMVVEVWARAAPANTNAPTMTTALNARKPVRRRKVTPFSMLLEPAKVSKPAP
jgi:hypothetical protein